jgi:hypothetical protein
VAAALHGGARRRARVRAVLVKGGGCKRGRARARYKGKPRKGASGTAGGSPRRGCSAGGDGAPAAGVPVPRVRHGLRHLAQKEQERALMLTEGSGRAGGPCRGVGNVDRRRRCGEARGQGRRRASPASGSHGSTQDGPAEVLPRSGRTETHWR